MSHRVKPGILVGAVAVLAAAVGPRARAGTAVVRKVAGLTQHRLRRDLHPGHFAGGVHACVGLEPVPQQLFRVLETLLGLRRRRKNRKEKKTAWPGESSADMAQLRQNGLFKMMA